MNEVEAVKAAIKLASCPGREGPFGGYDYGYNEAFYGPAPEDGRYVIRDFRDPKSPDWGKWLHQTDNREEHEAMFVKEQSVKGFIKSGHADTENSKRIFFSGAYAVQSAAELIEQGAHHDPA